MKKKTLGILFIALFAADPAMTYTGISVYTEFPSIYTTGTEMITFDLTVRNYRLNFKKRINNADEPTG